MWSKWAWLGIFLRAPLGKPLHDNPACTPGGILILIKPAVITVTDVTAGITATAVFFCNVTGATIADGVSYSWRLTQNGVFPVDAFPARIFDQRVSGNLLDTLTITYLSGLEQNYDYRCTVSIGGIMNVIGFATGSLTSPGVYYFLLHIMNLTLSL